MDALQEPGTALLGFWQPDGDWYPCVLLRVRGRDLKPKVRWEDGTVSVLETHEVRLRHIARKRSKEVSTEGQLDVKRQKQTCSVSVPRALTVTPAGRHKLPSHQYVMAPMVGGSELPFRMLSRRFGTQLCYTPMIYSGPFSSDEAYRAVPEHGFQTCPEDRPLVAHFCGNDPEVMLAAARHVVDRVDAVDLNLGCPQRVAHAEHFGAYLLDPEDRELVCSIVKRLSEALPVPVFCKIRLLDHLEDTLQLVRQLEASGASLLAVHARYRGTPTHRRDGPAHLDQVHAIKQVVQIPVLANGNVKSWDDVVANLQSTNADGIMSAEGMLDDPCLFAGALGGATGTHQEQLCRLEKKIQKVEKLKQKQVAGSTLSEDELEKLSQHKQLRKERRQLRQASNMPLEIPKDGLEKARLYLKSVAEHPPAPPLSTLIFHCRRMAKAELTSFQLLEDFASSKSLEAAKMLLSKAESYRDSPGSFTASREKEQQDREARMKQDYEIECRRKFEQRMARKAARQGVPLAEVMRSTSVPGGTMSFSSEPSWLLEKGDVEETADKQKAGKGKGKGKGKTKLKGKGKGKGKMGGHS